MHFHSPPHVPALFIYPTTRGILMFCVLYMQKCSYVLMCTFNIQLCNVTFLVLLFVLSCSAKVCEEKLRYAAYNCVAIDTDMSPWEEWSLCCFSKNTLYFTVEWKEILPSLSKYLHNCQLILAVYNKELYETWKWIWVVSWIKHLMN